MHFSVTKYTAHTDFLLISLFTGFNFLKRIYIVYIFFYKNIVIELQMGRSQAN